MNPTDHPSDIAIASAWAALETYGAYRPDVLRTPAGVAAGVRVWRAALRGLDDRALEEAVGRWGGRGERSRWPSPGELIGAVVERPATADDGWGELLAHMRRASSGAIPLRPDEPDPWRLSDDPTEDLARWRALAAAGGADVVRRGGEDAACRFASAYSACVERARQEIGRRERVGFRRIRDSWPERADAESAWRETVAALRDRDHPPLAPGDHRFRLHADQRTERAMWRGLQAVGGWRDLCETLPAAKDEQAPSAASFRRAFDEELARPLTPIDLRRRLDDRRAARLTVHEGGGR